MGVLLIKHDEIKQLLGEPNYTSYDDPKVGASWLLEDTNGNQHAIWRYKVAATYAVFSQDKTVLNKLFNNRIVWR